ncbi:hypothetical protein MP228_005027 [Amoeboaphelidium protococcarum]|nr:hypothetical protein MP228_005027 [Amoeboaphelidium protococcarum]
MNFVKVRRLLSAARPSNVIRIVEVGPRDGLQNEKLTLSAADRIQFIRDLSKAGLSRVEAAAFVSPKWVPQMSGAAEIMTQISQNQVSGQYFPALVPNVKGLESFIEATANAVQPLQREIAIFTAASDSFNLKNTNVNVKESLKKFEQVISMAQDNGIRVRGYLSCVLGCPYEGLNVDFTKVRDLCSSLLDMGCYEVSLSDTIGTGTAVKVEQMIDCLQSKSSASSSDLSRIAVHFHDTYGQALANIHQSIKMGIRTVDSSVNGLGGCPYAQGASGNVATEDVLYLLRDLTESDKLKLEIFDNQQGEIAYIQGREAIDNMLKKVAVVGSQMSRRLNRPIGSKVAAAVLGKSNASNQSKL